MTIEELIDCFGDGLLRRTHKSAAFLHFGG